ncbi:MAG: hypothetical protein AAF420_14055 [Pseudomonadota bacterium]
MLKDFSFIKELLSSPLFLLVVLVLMILSPTLYRWFSHRQKCEYCNRGHMREAQAKPIGASHFDCSRHSTSLIRVEVTYRCTHCDEFKVVVENRKSM